MCEYERELNLLRVSAKHLMQVKAEHKAVEQMRRTLTKAATFNFDQMLFTGDDFGAEGIIFVPRSVIDRLVNWKGRLSTVMRSLLGDGDVVFDKVHWKELCSKLLTEVVALEMEVFRLSRGREEGAEGRVAAQPA